MAFKTPQETTQAAIAGGTAKAGVTFGKAVVGSILAGAYIGLGGLVAIVVSSGLDPERWGTLPVLFSGAVFSLGLILVVLLGSDLLTGNMATLPAAMAARKVKLLSLIRNFGIITIGNLIGALLVAYFLAVQTGVIAEGELTLDRLEEIAVLKAQEESVWQMFLRAVGANWLVCLAVWMAFSAEDVGGKILAIFFPILGFVAIGFDHVVANMFFLPAALFAGIDISIPEILVNLGMSFVGNLVGGGLFVGLFYFFLHGRARDMPGRDDHDDGPRGGDRGGLRGGHDRHADRDASPGDGGAVPAGTSARTAR
jgi:formate/nitrite transporter